MLCFYSILTLVFHFLFPVCVTITHGRRGTKKLNLNPEIEFNVKVKSSFYKTIKCWCCIDNTYMIISWSLTNPAHISGIVYLLFISSSWSFDSFCFGKSPSNPHSTNPNCLLKSTSLGPYTTFVFYSHNYHHLLVLQLHACVTLQSLARYNVNIMKW